MRHRNVLGFGIGLAWALCSCGSSDPNAAYEGCATDENLATLDDYIKTNRVGSDAAKSPSWVQPATGGGALPSSTVFAWLPTATAMGNSNGDASCPQFQPTSLGPRHLPAVSGTVFDVHFAVGGVEQYRLLTTRQQTQLPAMRWQALAGQQVSVQLYSVKLLRNDVVEGPFKAAAITFMAQP